MNALFTKVYESYDSLRAQRLRRFTKVTVVYEDLHVSFVFLKMRAFCIGISMISSFFFLLLHK